MEIKACSYCQRERRPHLHLVLRVCGQDVLGPPICSFREAAAIIAAAVRPGEMIANAIISHETANRYFTIGSVLAERLLLEAGRCNLPEDGNFNVISHFRSLQDAIREREKEAAEKEPLPPGYPFTRRVV